MNAVTDITAHEAATLDPYEERVEARLRDLAELRAMGMDIARTVHKQAKAQEELQDIGDRAGVKEEIGCVVTLAVRGDFGLAFARISRAVQTAILQEGRLEKELREHRAGLAAEPARARRAAVERVMLNTIRQNSSGIQTLVEDYQAHLYEQLDHEDFESRPVSAIIRRLGKDLALTPDWDRWADEPWAIEEARAGVAGSPYRLVETPPKAEGAAKKPAAPRKTGPP